MHSWDQNAGWAGGATLGSDRFWLTSLLHHILYVCFYVFCKRGVSSRCHVLFSLHTHSLSGACSLPLCGQGTCSLPSPQGSRLSDATSSKNPSVHPRSSQGRPTGPSSLAAGGVSKSASSKKTKKGKKGQKLDPVLLGFSVHAADRPNIGEIQSVNNTRR